MEEIRRHKTPRPQVQEGENQGEVQKSEKPLPNRIKIISKNKAVSLNVDTQMITLASGHKVYYEKVFLFRVIISSVTRRCSSIFDSSFSLPPEARQRFFLP
jgi:hypothetical protein